MINSLNSLLPWHRGPACPACPCTSLWLSTPYPCPRIPLQPPEPSKGDSHCLGLPWCPHCPIPGWGDGMGSGCQALSWQSHGEPPWGPDSTFFMSRVQRWMVLSKLSARSNYCVPEKANTMFEASYVPEFSSALNGKGSSQWAS